MTPQEKQLWYHFLSGHALHFRRQHPVAYYILDFYCAKAKLAIEIDGAEHYTESGKISDQARTELLNKYGITVIRFSNSQIDHHFDDVCKVIDEELARIMGNR